VEDSASVVIVPHTTVDLVVYKVSLLQKMHVHYFEQFVGFKAEVMEGLRNLFMKFVDVGPFLLYGS